MVELTHEQIESLLGAYCLDAVEPEERDAVEAHLPECPRCRAEVAELREVAALLANNDDAAPEGVWDRIAEAIDEVPPPMRLDVRRRRGRDVAAVVLAAAAVVALVVLGWQVRDLRHDNDRVQRQLADANATSSTLNDANLAVLAPGSQLVRMNGTNGQQAAAVVTQEGAGYFLGVSLPHLDTGVYELWGAGATGAPTPLGSLARPGVLRFNVGGDVTTLMVTVEPEYVSQPTSTPVMQGNLA